MSLPCSTAEELIPLICGPCVRWNPPVSRTSACIRGMEVPSTVILKENKLYLQCIHDVVGPATDALAAIKSSIS